MKSLLRNICLKKNDDIANFDDKKNANNFKKFFFCTLADNLLADFSPSSLIFDLNSNRQYYEKILKYRKSNNDPNTELFRIDNLHLNRKCYEKLSKLFIGEIESLQITLRRQNLKAPRKYTEAVSFSRASDQFPLLSNLL